MELINATRMLAGYTLGIEPSGRELLVVVVKGTFRIPVRSGEKLRLHEEQIPLLTSDEFFGDPGLSAPKYEIDYSPRKQRCDILLNGQAYAPGGQPTDRVVVGLGIGSWSKSFTVVGDRAWYFAGGARATGAAPFTTLPISYDHAFGGVDLRHEDPAEHAAFMPNPSGRGFHRHLRPEWLQDSPLPNTEEIGAPVDRPDGNYRPMSFGPLGRHWDPRYRYAGTYDQHWQDEVFPFLPSDFDERYYQAAPAEQQLPTPLGEQLVTLFNLTPDGRRDFLLPHLEAPFFIFPKVGEREECTAPVDTVMIEPDLERVTMTWRLTRPLKRSLFEIVRVQVGRHGREWWQLQNEIVFPVPMIEPAKRREPETVE